MRARGTGSIEERPSGFLARLDDAAGRRSVGTFTTREEAEAVLDAVRGELLLDRSAEGVTLDAWGARTLDRREQAGLRGARAHERWLFPASHGGRYKQFPEEQWREIRNAAKLTGGPHTLRHSFASMFLRSTRDMFLLAQVLGHSSTRVTALYSHLLPGHLDRARNAVDLGPALTEAPRPSRRKAR